MADNTLPDRNLPPEATHQGEDNPSADRRAMLRRAAIGLPVILATVHGRTVWAASASPSAAGSKKP
jgi:hypothetical protein